jgi:hypothetical protein
VKKPSSRWTDFCENLHCGFCSNLCIKFNYDYTRIKALYNYTYMHLLLIWLRTLLWLPVTKGTSFTNVCVAPIVTFVVWFLWLPWNCGCHGYQDYKCIFIFTYIVHWLLWLRGHVRNALICRHFLSCCLAELLSNPYYCT